MHVFQNHESIINVKQKIYNNSLLNTLSYWIKINQLKQPGMKYSTAEK